MAYKTTTATEQRGSAAGSAAGPAAGPAAICFCLTGANLDAWRRQWAANRRWADMAELRVDLLQEFNPAELAQFVREELQATPFILTVRRTADLGAWRGTEVERIALLRQLCALLRPAYVDLELGVEAADIVPSGCAIVRSIHVQDGLPASTADVLNALCAEPHGVVKLAVAPRSTAELAEFTSALDEWVVARADVPRMVTLAMGPFGTPTRVAPARYHSAWSYCSDASGVQAAPGHLSAQTLREVYRVAEARADWPLFAIVGNPVAHSRSPHYHNARFTSAGKEAQYIPLLVDDFAAFERLADLLPLRGCSVTIPHKEMALRVALRRDSGAQRLQAVGACNTLVRSADGWRGVNTDIEGFVAPLRDVQTTGKTAAVIGAGGAARAVVVGLLELGFRPLLFNRTLARAQTLAADLGLADEAARTLDDGRPIPADVAVIVQTTSVGMEPEIAADPIPAYRFSGHEVVYDIIYTPERTALLARAAAAGCRTITGRAMFEAQAAAQSILFMEALQNPA